MRPASKPLSLSIGGVLAMVLGGLTILGSLCSGAGGLASSFTLKLQDTTDHHNIMLARIASDIRALEADIAGGVAEAGAQSKLDALRLEEKDVSEHFEETKRVRREVTRNSALAMACVALPSLFLAGFLVFFGIKTLGASDPHRRRAIMTCGAMCVLMLVYAGVHFFWVLPQSRHMNELVFDPKYMPPQMMIMDMKAMTYYGSIVSAVMMLGVLSLFGLVMFLLNQRSAREWCAQQPT